MTTTTWTLGTAAFTALLVLLPAAQKGDSKDKRGGRGAKGAPAKLEPWLGKLADAKARAKERNVPVLVHVILEGEEDNDRYRDTILADADLLKRSADAIVIVANNGTHARKTVEETIDDEKVSREVCSVYPAFALCSQHQAAWEEIYRDFHEENGDLKCPQTIVLLPDGQLSGGINTSTVPPATEIVALIVEAQKKAGPGLTEEELATVLRGLEEGRNLTAAKAWPAAWKAWGTVLALTQKGPYAEEAGKEQPKALEGMRAEFERLCAGLVPGTAAKAYQDLAAYALELAGTPLEKDAAQELKKAENNKAIRDEIKAWKLSQEADAILREARDAFDAGDTKKGERAVRKLLHKRFAETPAAEMARKLWPDLAREIDG